MSLITRVCQCWVVSTVRFLNFFLHNIKTTHVRDPFHMKGLQLRHYIYFTVYNKNHLDEVLGVNFNISHKICFPWYVNIYNFTNCCCYFLLRFLKPRELHVLLFIYILISLKQETLWPSVQRLQTNSLYYTWLPLGYITSECKSLNSLTKYCRE
jgi:hypothetical protein